MSTIFSILGIIGAFYLIRYRQQVGDMMGEAEWMRKVGGVYNVLILVAIFIFFWCIAELTGTSHLFFLPLTYVIPGLRSWETPQ